MLPNPLEDIARKLDEYNKRLSHLERLEEGGAWTLIEDKHLAGTAASLVFSSIPATFVHLKLLFSLRSNKAASTDDGVSVRINADAGNNYDYLITSIAHNANLITAEGYAQTVFDEIFSIPASTAPANVFDGGTLTFFDYADTSNSKAVLYAGTLKLTVAAGGLRLRQTVASYRGTAAIATIALIPTTGPFSIGSRASLYGISA